ncbi:MAG: YdcH family protein [Pseudomonadota bacterium]
MTFSSFRLMQYHQKIDRELRAENTRRWPDIFRIQKLKRLKLAIKDRLESHTKASLRRPLRLNKI